MSGFSSVQNISPLPDTDNSPRARYARAGLLEVFSGTADPTNGARRWDGTDFIAWGLHSPSGNAHAKFREYKHISIPKAIYDEFLANSLKAYPRGHVNYHHQPYAIPAAVFGDVRNGANGDFSYDTGSVVSDSLVAVAAKGLTIFWKIV